MITQRDLPPALAYGPSYRTVGLIALAHAHAYVIVPGPALALAGEAVAFARAIGMRYIETDALDVLAQINPARSP